MDGHRFLGWIRRLREITLIGFLCLLALIDLGLALDDPLTSVVSQFAGLGGVAGVAATLLRRRYRVRGFLALLGVSATVSTAALLTPGDVYPSMAEFVAILVLTIGVLRWVEVSHATLLAALSLVVLLLVAGMRLPGDASLAVGFLYLMSWTMAVGTGSYLRFQQERRTRAVQSVRRAERLDLARELHDLVAHHITGIVVQAQAARTVAEHKPEAVLPALDAIATSGADALTSMRRLVSVLRAQEDAARTPGSSLADLHVLVEHFSSDGPQVTFEIGQGISDHVLPPEVMTTLHRVLQESLTNIRRHAPRTGGVRVDLRLVGGKVRLSVRNWRTGSDHRLSRLGGGFGLVGMAERVEALGGRLWAGPTPDGCWEVQAVF